MKKLIKGISQSFFLRETNENSFKLINQKPCFKTYELY